MTVELTVTNRAVSLRQSRPLASGIAGPMQTPAVSPAKQVAQSGDAPSSFSGPGLSVETILASQQQDEQATEPGQLTEDEQEIVDDLRQRDREVRQHEQAHASKGGPFAGAPSYDTVRGPDGNSYAVGGEVKIDASPVRGNPEATIRKMEIVKRAALAPAEPSSQDRAVAARADAQKAKAQSELRQLEAEEAGGNGGFSADAGQIGQSNVMNIIKSRNSAAQYSLTQELPVEAGGYTTQTLLA